MLSSRTGGKYSVTEGGLIVRNVTHLDSGKYTCRAFETTNKSSVSGSTVIELKVRREYICTRFNVKQKYRVPDE